MGVDPLTITIGIAAVSALTSGAQTYSATKNANEMKQQQKKQLRLQRKAELIRARREARIKAAQFTSATSGAGIGGSISEGVLTGIRTSLTSGVEAADEQYALQAEQFDIAASTTKQNAFFDFGQNVASSGAMLYNTGMFDPSGTPALDANRPGGTGTPYYFLKPAGE